MSKKPKLTLAGSLIDKTDPARLTPRLIDSKGNDLDIPGTTEDILEIIVRQEKKKSSFVRHHLTPVCTQILQAIIQKNLGMAGVLAITRSEVLMFLQDIIRIGYFLRKLEEKGLTIQTDREPITQEEVEEMEKATETNAKITTLVALGLGVIDTIALLQATNQLSPEEIEELELSEKEKKEVERKVEDIKKSMPELTKKDLGFN